MLGICLSYAGESEYSFPCQFLIKLHFLWKEQKANLNKKKFFFFFLPTCCQAVNHLLWTAAGSDPVLFVLPLLVLGEEAAGAARLSPAARAGFWASPMLTSPGAGHALCCSVLLTMLHHLFFLSCTYFTSTFACQSCQMGIFVLVLGY